MGRMTCGCAALRSRVELLARTGRRSDAVPADADRLSGNAGRRRLQRHLAALGLAYDLFGNGKTA